jgi:hypothetical protein
MAVYVFFGLNRQKATRKAIDFWYRHMKNKMDLVAFLKCCRLIVQSTNMLSKEYLVIYNGEPPDKDYEQN